MIKSNENSNLLDKIRELEKNIKESLFDLKNKVDLEEKSEKEIKQNIIEIDEEIKSSFLSNLSEKEQLLFSKYFEYEQISLNAKNIWKNDLINDLNSEESLELFEYNDFDSLSIEEVEDISERYVYEKQKILKIFKLSLNDEENSIQNNENFSSVTLAHQILDSKKNLQFEEIDKKVKELSSLSSLIAPEGANISHKMKIGGGSFTNGENLETGLFDFMIDKPSQEEIPPSLSILNGLLSHEMMHSHFTTFEIPEDIKDSSTIRIPESEPKTNGSLEILNGLLTHEYAHSKYTPLEHLSKEDEESKIDLDL